MFQQLTILGRVGSIEQRFTPSGVPVTTMSVAVNRTWNDANGQRQEKTTWFRITCWRTLAEVVGQYVTKGQTVLVVGELEDARAYTDKAGEQRASLEVTAQTVKFIGSRDSSDSAPQKTQAAQGNAAGTFTEDDVPF